MPADAKKGSLENAAGNASNDYDVMEDKFQKLKKASVICADYELLRQDFPELYSLDNAKIDQWLLNNTAYLSEGQIERLSKGGDHADKLGMKDGDLDDYIDKNDKTSAIRIRSGGRAATFFAGKTYRFIKNQLVAKMIDVKGVGTHKLADISHPKVTGLLNLADALREIMIQRLIQRLIELEGLEHKVNTVKFYGIVDTGLQYKGKNPATGWENERCVLTLRQRNSRILDGYEGFNFSGVCPEQVIKTGPGRELRRLLVKYGVSAEFFPRALLYNTEDTDGVAMASNATTGILDDLAGTWNLQSDATGANMMDFTDYYVLPKAPLPPQWRMSEKALSDALCLERTPFVKIAMSSPALMKRVYGGKSDKKEAEQWYSERLAALSKDPKMKEAAIKINKETGKIEPFKPKFCMCWFMELDDSKMSIWAMKTAKDFEKSGESKIDILAHIDDSLPVSRVSNPPLQTFPTRGKEVLPAFLSAPILPDSQSALVPENVYHSGWEPKTKQKCPYGNKFLSMTPAEIGRGTYKLLISCIVPRPIALVSTVSAKGVRNLAPYSYFGAMNHNPPTVCFSPCRNRNGNEKDGFDKDTLRNIKETGEFVLHIMSKWFVDVANFSCGSFLPGEDEFELSGATPIPSTKVKAPRVEEAAIQLECKLAALHEIKDDDGLVKATMVIGNILVFHINEGVYDKNTQTVDAAKLQPISRMGGNTYGQTAGMFDLPRPDRKVN